MKNSFLYNKFTILVVDDEPGNIDVLRGILQPDYKVVAATNGVKGLQLANMNPPPDLIILDVKMPDMDGYEVCQELKSNASTRNIPVIFVTADAKNTSEEYGLSLGAADYITKPFNPVLTKARISNHVQLKRYHDDLEEMIYESTRELELERTKLAKSEKLYRSLMETAPDAILLVNSGGIIELVNQTAEIIFGYEAIELIGNKVEILVPDKIVDGHVDKRMSFTAAPYKRARMSLGVVSAKRKNGSCFPVDITLSPVDTDEGSMIICDVRDMTEDIKTQKQILQSQKMDAVGQLTGGIAHDFNNILNSILGFSKLGLGLDEVKENDKLNEFFSIIHQSGEKARDLIKQMLAFSRGDCAGEMRTVTLVPLLEEVMAMMRPILPSTINLVLDLDEDVDEIVADPVQINQMLMNLCINARDALNEVGDIKLSLEQIHSSTEECCSCQNELDGEYVVVAVTDNGAGIDDGDLSRIFDPFYSTKEVGKGSGMGLSVVHGIMHSMGGHIIVETSKATGTSFKLFFSSTVANDEPSVMQPSEEDILSNSNGERIMVVDDEEHIASYLDVLLTEKGYKVVTFASSTSAFDYFKNNQNEIDLVITDQTMPSLTGYEMSKKMLKIRNDIPIIMVSGYSKLVDEKSARALGITAYLDKPIDQNLLFTAVNNSLSSHDGARATTVF